jgi:alpha-amylase
LLQGFYKLGPNRAVPSSADGDLKTPWWWDHLAAQARALSLAGFTAVWLPPRAEDRLRVRPAGGRLRPFDDYDIGSRNQKGSVPTRYGTREQLLRCVAILRANGLDVYLDMVEHQRIGDVTPFVFRYPSANGTPNAGRFPKNPSNFVRQVPRDPNLGGPVADDFAFGRELAPINARPPRYLLDNLVAAGDWLTCALDAQGYRVDDVKGLSTDFLFPFLTMAKVMTSDPDPNDPKDGQDSEESAIPAAFTYFGQFIDHDLTFDPASSLQKQNDPDALQDFRTPQFDLDNIYGPGPVRPAVYVQR